MQQKQQLPRLTLFLIGFFFLIAAGLTILMTMDAPAPQTPIEKSLDAKAFLGNK